MQAEVDRDLVLDVEFHISFDDATEALFHDIHAIGSGLQSVESINSLTVGESPIREASVYVREGNADTSNRLAGRVGYQPSHCGIRVGAQLNSARTETQKHQQSSTSAFIRVARIVRVSVDRIQATIYPELESGRHF